jgi:two-component system, response regulator PdtaR
MHAARVLLAKPDGPLRSAMVDALQAAGFVVLPTTGDPTEPPPDIAVVWLTPSAHGLACEGLDLAKALSEAHVPFIAVTSDKDDTSRRQVNELGAIGYFIRPLAPNVLVPLVQAGLQWMAKWHQVSEGRRCLLEALVQSRGIATAVGIIAERHRLTPQRAFERLRRKARDERRTVVDLAAGVLDGSVDLPDSGWLDAARP